LEFAEKFDKEHGCGRDTDHMTSAMSRDRFFVISGVSKSDHLAFAMSGAMKELSELARQQ
jgi:hypothetical protein